MNAAAPTGLDWLYSTQLFGIKLGLENVHRLLRDLDLPPPGMKFIHVAGTNGKGSTCALIHSLLGAGGVNAGLFTSPHLIRFNERIRDGARMIEDGEVEAGLQRLRERVSGWQPHPTFFELAFALALDWFRERGLEWVVLETGLGGRLDATNAITPRVSVITSIGWDHMSILGDTLPKIAAEKAGIIKPGVPVITQPQPEEVLQKLRANADRQGAPFQVVQPWGGEEPGLAGSHQRQNAALALAAVRAAGFALTDAQVTRGLKEVSWPGRFQRAGDWILDGAHNPEAVQALTNTWRDRFGSQKAPVVFGAASDKDAAQMLRLLSPIVAEWRFTRFQSPRSLAPEQLVSLARAGGLPQAPVSVAESVAQALAAPPAPAPGLVAGSLFLVGEALSLMKGASAAFRASVQ
jgi:dihydrofolate synthase/folylpolyglutamate synthase